MRYDLKVISSWIKPGTKVMDLGCGNGELLDFLKRDKQVTAYGIEEHEEKVANCVARGLNVLQGDINAEIIDYPDDSFDYIIVSQTLQQIYRPGILLDNLMRIGKKAIVSFPNFSHWSMRLGLLFYGNAPKNPQLPYEWHDSPNIRVITIKDFRHFIKGHGFVILREADINTSRRDLSGRLVRFFPNLRATYGIFKIGRGTK